jgi:hypothetical protein
MSDVRGGLLAKNGHFRAHPDNVDGVRNAGQDMVGYGMRYEPVQFYTRETAEAAFARDDPTELNRVLLGLSWYEPDWRWVQEQCIRYSRHPHEHVRGVVPICFSYLARINRDLDVDAVFPVLEVLQADHSPWVAGNATEYVEDIKGLLFGIVNGLPFVRPEEFETELAVLKTLGWVTSVLRSMALPLESSIPSNISPERQLALYREAFHTMREHFAMLDLDDADQSGDPADGC